MKPPKLASTAGKGKNKRAFDLSIGTDDPEELDSDALNGAATTNGIDYGDDDEMLPNGDDQPIFDQSLDQGVLDEDHTEQQVPAGTEGDIRRVEPSGRKGMKPGTRKGGKRGPQASTVVPEDPQSSTPRRGRPPKKGQTSVFHDPDVGKMAAPPKTTGVNRKPPPKERNANAKIMKRDTSKQPSIRSASVGPRSRFLQRSETPANDDGALLTRSGRHSFKPLKSWLGEKLVMGDRTIDALPAIKEVVRVDEINEGPRPRARRSAYRKPKRRARSQLSDLEEEEDDHDERDDWEVNDGIKVAQVMEWDPETNKYDEDNTREEDVAYSFDAIEMRDIANAEFKFAKTLTLDFFGAGMVEVPPGGAKRIKNSRKMQMVFFVFYGRVMVNIGTPPTRFSIGKGGQWQVPRGELF
ncbi:centromere protein C, partial [Lecanoromycetidae sp. Uapishka_2]